MPLCNFGEVVVFLRIVLFLFRNQALDKQILYAFTRREGSLHDICEFQSNGVPVPEERCAHSNANGVAVPFQTA